MNKVKDRVLPMALTINHGQVEGLRRHHYERSQKKTQIVKHPLEKRNNDTLHFQ